MLFLKQILPVGTSKASLCCDWSFLEKVMVPPGVVMVAQYLMWQTGYIYWYIGEDIVDPILWCIVSLRSEGFDCNLTV